MALIFEGHTNCGICGKILKESDKITGLPPSSSQDNPLYNFFDQGFHQECFDNWDKKEEILDIIKRDRRDFELSEQYLEMKEKYGAPKNVLNKTNLATHILEKYKSGLRRFTDLEIENESLANENLEGIIFENCMLYVDFKNANLRNSQFLNGHVKTSDFRNADLTGARFENQGLESTRFKGAKTDNLIFINNSCYSKENLNIDDFEKYFKNE